MHKGIYRTERHPYEGGEELHKGVYRTERDPYEGGRGCIRVSMAQNGALINEEEAA